MRRSSRTIPNTGRNKQLEHYVNGKDTSDGMHPGIRKKCPICNSDAITDWSLLTSEQLEKIIDKYTG